MVSVLDFSASIVMKLQYNKPPNVDSTCYISAGAYEVIDHLYYAWGIYLENGDRKLEVKRGYKSQSAMENDEEMPCIGCHSRALCEEDGYECSHYKAWTTNGFYDPTACTWK